MTHLEDDFIYESDTDYDEFALYSNAEALSEYVLDILGIPEYTTAQKTNEIKQAIVAALSRYDDDSLAPTLNHLFTVMDVIEAHF